MRAAERDGATLRLGTRVTALRPDGGGWTLWLGDGTRASAEVVIVACGPWANTLTRGLGGVVPLALSRGQAGRFRPPHAFGLPGPIISDHVHELWIKPEGNDGHYLIGGRGGRLDRSPHKRPTGQAGADDAMLETFAGELAYRLPGTAGGVWRGSWSSFYDFTPDGNPVIDQIPGRANLITATGMSGHCFKLAPSLGLGTAELVVDGQVRSFDWSVFAYGRFARTRARGSPPAADPDDRRRAARGRRGLALPRRGRRRQAARAGRRAPARRAGAGRPGRGPAGRSRGRARARTPRSCWPRPTCTAREPSATSTGSAAWPRPCTPGSRRSTRPARPRSSCWATARRWRPRRSAAWPRQPTDAEGLIAASYGGEAAATRSRSPARSGRGSRDEGEQGARVLGEPSALVDCSDLPAPGDADTPADLPLP